MAGKIIADTLEHSTAGSVTTDYVVEGSAKAWLNWNTVTSHSTRDSLNVSSITDGGTGITTITFTSSMNDSNYHSMFFTSSNAGSNTGSFENSFAGSNGIGRTASSCIMGSYAVSAYVDALHNDWSMLGDLA